MANVFIAERMASTTVGSYLRSLQSATAIENGLLVAQGALISGERDVYTATTVSAITDPVYIIDGVVLDPNETPKQGLNDWINPKDKGFRARKPVAGDMFSVSVEACAPLSTTLVVGNYVETSATGGLMTESATISLTTSFVAEIKELWNFGTQALPMVRLEVKRGL